MLGRPLHTVRRWIIAGVLLFLGGIAVSWSWPRGDARFVGRWQWTDSDGLPNGSFVTVSSSGFGKQFENGRVDPYDHHWTVEGDRLSIKFYRTGLSGARRRLIEMWHQLAGIPSAHKYQRWLIRDVTTDRISLENLGVFAGENCDTPGSGTQFLIRVPDERVGAAVSALVDK